MSINDLLQKDGYGYRFDPSACVSCGGECCTGESGYIWVKRDEIDLIAKFVKVSVCEFTLMYLKKVKHKYSLREKRLSENNYACIFFDNFLQKCSIYPVRPLQCRTFPFWEQFKTDEQTLVQECPGVVCGK